MKKIIEEKVKIIESRLNDIAKEANIETLETRNSDDLDFKDLAVWTIKSMMIKSLYMDLDSVYNDLPTFEELSQEDQDEINLFCKGKEIPDNVKVYFYINSKIREALERT